MVERAANFVPGLGRVFREGERNDTLFRCACALRGRGGSQSEIERALETLNRRCQPPLDANELQRIAVSAAGYSAGGPDALDAAWSRAKEKQHGSKFALFVELARELQLARGGFTAALPVQKIAALFGCHYTFVSQLRRKAESMELITRSERHSWKRHRAAEFQVDLERTREFLTSLIRAPHDCSNKSYPSKLSIESETSKLSNETLIKPFYGSDKSGNREFIESERAYLKLAARGWRLFPCKPLSKEPAISRWPERATTNTAELGKWFEKFPDANFGLACGVASGVFVVDLDGPTGLNSFWQLAGGDVAVMDAIVTSTLASKTPRGAHLFFEYPDGVTIRNSASRLAPNIDVRGENGYVVIPPGIHPSGEAYRWLCDADGPIAPPPTWITELLQVIRQ
jgi:hypothetical protein